MTHTTDRLRVYLFDFGDPREWVVAHSEDDAFAAYEETVGIARGESELDGVTVRALADDEPLTLTLDPSSPVQSTETHTAAEWAAKMPRGFFASTEW